ncbi:MAG: lipoate--protein ligase family protein, partial [Candidatus Eremiobacteraeota bacterium]|nr:lipoate--protein ligase family protein [Candidatus Eremiobacteraeota bacterium]
MAADYHLLAQGPTPCLRLYRWSRPSLSLGYRQKTDWLEPSSLSRYGLDLVRRPSGGRALLHDDELTYALVVEARGKPHLPTAYRRLTQLLARALQACGVQVGFAGEQRLFPSRSHPGCMSISIAGEITYRGRKLVGSAQTCQGNRLLQHGVIPLRVDGARLSQVIPTETGVQGLVDQGG